MTPAGAPPLGRFVAVGALAYLTLTLLVFQPTPSRIAGSVISDAGDPLFVASVLEWVAESTHHGFAGLWDQPIFFPFHGALALSDHFLNPGVLAALLPRSMPRGLLVFNLAALATFPLAGVATAYVLRRTGLPPLAAFAGGLVYAFAPFRFSQLSHLAVLMGQWIPLLLWTWDRLLAAPSRRRALAFAAVYALHVTGGSYLAYMAHVPLAVIGALRLRRHRRELLQRASLRVLAPTLAFCGLVATAVFLPYVLISQRAGLARNRGEVLIWGATLWSYVTPSARFAYAAWWPPTFARPENELFAGFAPTLLAVFGLMALARSGTAPPISRPRRWAVGGLAVLAVGALVLGDAATLAASPNGMLAGVPSFGHKRPAWWFAAAILTAVWLSRRNRFAPGVSWWRRLTTWERGLLLGGGACALLTLPVVFLPARHLLPGLSGMRVPARFYPFVSLPLAYLAGRGVAAIAARLSPILGTLVSSGMVLLLCWELSPSVPWEAVPDLTQDLPGAHRWLASHKREVGSYLELPVAEPTLEIRGMYFQTRHWLPTVNGYSGYFPDPLGLRRCCTGADLDDAGLTRLREAGVTHLLVSRWKISQGPDRPWHRLELRLLRRGWARQRYRDRQGSVLEILPSPQPSRGGTASRARPERRGAVHHHRRPHHRRPREEALARPRSQ